MNRFITTVTAGALAAAFAAAFAIAPAAAQNLPPDRNPFQLAIIPPKGSMYPLLRIEKLPAWQATVK